MNAKFWRAWIFVAKHQPAIKCHSSWEIRSTAQANNPTKSSTHLKNQSLPPPSFVLFLQPFLFIFLFASFALRPLLCISCPRSSQSLLPNFSTSHPYSNPMPWPQRSPWLLITLFNFLAWSLASFLRPLWHVSKIKNCHRLRFNDRACLIFLFVDAGNFCTYKKLLDLSLNRDDVNLDH